MSTAISIGLLDARWWHSGVDLFGALAKLERNLIRERTQAALAAAQ